MAEAPASAKPNCVCLRLCLRLLYQCRLFACKKRKLVRYGRHACLNQTEKLTVIRHNLKK